VSYLVHYAECRYSDSHYTEWRYSDSHYTEWRGAIFLGFILYLEKLLSKQDKCKHGCETILQCHSIEQHKLDTDAVQQLS